MILSTETFFDKADNNTKLIVALELEKLGDTSGANLLLRMLSDKDSSARLIAIRHLGKLKDGRAVKPLLEMLNEEDNDLSQYVVEALGNIEDVQAVEALTNIILNDQNLRLRLKSYSALVKIQPNTVSKSLTDKLLGSLVAKINELYARTEEVLVDTEEITYMGAHNMQYWEREETYETRLDPDHKSIQELRELIPSSIQSLIDSSDKIVKTPNFVPYVTGKTVPFGQQ